MKSYMVSKLFIPDFLMNHRNGSRAAENINKSNFTIYSCNTLSLCCFFRSSYN